MKTTLGPRPRAQGREGEAQFALTLTDANANTFTAGQISKRTQTYST